MTSKLKQAILDLKNQIGTIQLNDAQAFQYCAIFNNQVKLEDEGKTFNFPKPAVLIEIQNPTQGVALLGSGVTINENLIWRLSIVHEQLNASINDIDPPAPATGMDENLDVYDLRDLLKTALTGFKLTGCSQLQYVEESQDYEHDNIYVYGVSFKCSFVDTKGSGYDPDSTMWKTGQITAVNLNTFIAWQTGQSYVALENAVIYNGLIYLCTTTNSDTTFTVGNWQLIAAWVPSTSYTATTSYVAYQNHIYQCLNSNSDAIFNNSNWTQIV